ncbi:MAG: glycosyl hydrolase family 28-related protein [Actinomycetota bacterium]
MRYLASILTCVVGLVLAVAVVTSVTSVDASREQTECAVGATTLDDARSGYDSTCTPPRIDCDRTGDVWVCSSEPIGSGVPGGGLRGPGHCLASAETLAEARAQFAEGCELPRADCDPIGTTWVCSSQRLRSQAATGIVPPHTSEPVTTGRPEPAPPATQLPSLQPGQLPKPSQRPVPEPDPVKESPETTTTTQPPTTSQAPTTTQPPTTSQAPTTVATTPPTSERPAPVVVSPGEAGNRRIVAISDYGVVPSARSDRARAINTAIEKASRDGVSLRFAAGDYRIDGDVHLRDGVGLYGAEDGHSRLIAPGSARRIVAGEDSSATNAAIDGLVLDNISIHALRTPADGLQITNNLITDVKDDQQIHVNQSRGVYVAGNVLIRNDVNSGNSEYGDNDAIGSWKSSGMVIADNVIGGLTADVARSSALTDDMAARISGYMSTYGDEYDFWDGGFYSKGLDMSSATDFQILRNVFHGNPDPNYTVDHVVYLKGYERVTVAGNYFSGWPTDSRGGLKIRNGRGPIVVSNNYFDDVPVLTYILGNHVSEYEELRDTIIVDNTFDGDGAMVSFWNKTDRGRAENFAVYRNTFDTNGNRDLLILPGPAERGTEFLVAENTFEDGRLTARIDDDNHVTRNTSSSTRAELDRASSDIATPTVGTPKIDRRGNLP